MFGFKHRAQERETKIAARIAAAGEAAHTYLISELQDTVEWLILNHDLPNGGDTLLEKAISVRDGIDAVLLDGVDAFGTELASEDQRFEGGGMVAHAVRNVLLVTGTIDRATTQRRFCYILGFSRDGSEIRESES